MTGFCMTTILITLFLQLLLFTSLIVLLFYFRRRIHKKLLKRYTSDISGNIDIYEKYNGEKVLMTNYFVQGVSIDQPSIKDSYWYAVAEKTLSHCKKKKNASVLFIGLGANTSSLLIQQQNPTIHQIIVEIDPLIIRACREYFDLEKLKNAEIIQEDIFVSLKSKKKVWLRKYDVIVIDTFDAQPPYMLKGSHDPEFLDRLYPWLKRDGMFLFNTPVRTQGKKIEELL
jgi:spermidine synthase